MVDNIATESAGRPNAPLIKFTESEMVAFPDKVGDDEFRTERISDTASPSPREVENVETPPERCCSTIDALEYPAMLLSNVDPKYRNSRPESLRGTEPLLPPSIRLWIRESTTGGTWNASNTGPLELSI